MALVSTPFLVPLWVIDDAPISNVIWVLVTVSAIANVIIIIYHYLVPAHPKFLMVPWRHWVLRVHIISGSVELVAGVIACFYYPAPTAAVIMALTALLFHVPTAALQTTIVFGSRAIMWPAYSLCILFHAFCAIKLLLTPDSLWWATSTFLVFNVYVWVRLYFYLIDKLHLFADSKYTISILAAGGTIIPAILGPMGFVFFTCFIAIFVIAYRAIFLKTPGEYIDFVRERARDSAINRQVATMFFSDLDPDEDCETALDFFDGIDKDRDGTISQNDLRQVLEGWDLPGEAVQIFLDKSFNNQSLNFSKFYRDVWSLSGFRQKAIRSAEARKAESERDQAEFVFKMVDIDADGYIKMPELNLLLTEWGLPKSESKIYLGKYDLDGDKKISFDDFYRNMRPVWRFVYYDVVRSEFLAIKSDLIQRAFDAHLDAQKVQRLSQCLKQQLLFQVAFLKGADDDLIADLASSLTTEEFDEGKVVVNEGDKGDSFYLIGRGQLVVSKQGEKVTELGPGAYFGEGALLSEQMRSATITAISKCLLYKLSRASFEFILERFPTVRDDVLGAHHTRLQDIVRTNFRRQLAGQVPFLYGAKSEMIDDFSEHLRAIEFKDNEIVFKEDTVGDHFYIVCEGKIMLMRAGKHLADLGIGCSFGEGALLGAVRRNATAKSVGKHTVLYTLDSDAFKNLLKRYPEVNQNIQKIHQSRQV